MSGRERREERRFGPSKVTKRNGPTQRETQRREELKTIRTTSQPTTTKPTVSQAEASINKAKDTLKQAENLSTSYGSTIQWGDKTYDLGTTEGWKDYRQELRKAKSEINEAENQLTRYKTAASSAAAAKAANKVIEKANEVIGKANKITSKQYEEQIEAIEKLIKKGLAKREPSYGTRFGKSVKEGSKIVLTVPVSSLTDEMLDTAKKAGFDIPKLSKAPSFKLFEYGLGKGERVERTTQYYATVLGAGERAVNSTLGRLYSFLTGRNVNVRTVSQDTVELVRDLSPREKRLLTLGTVGGNYLGNYAAMIPVGAAGSIVFQGAKNVVSAAGAKTPAAVSKIATEIAKHPDLAKAVLWGPMVGIEADKIYADYKKGTPINEIYIDIAMSGGSLLGQIQGLETGFKLPTKLKEYWATQGRTPIPPEEIWRAETLNSNERLITYTNKNYKTTWSKEFKDLGKKLTAEKYLGEVAPEEYRLWHCTGNPWNVRVDETTLAMIGDHSEKFSGLFVASEPQHHFLRLGLNVGESGGRLGLPGVKGVSETFAVDALVEVMPGGMSRTATQEWLAKQLGTKTAYIPPISMITSEIEAILPPGSKLVKVGEAWYTNWAGHRVLVNKYALIAEGVALSSLPKGAKIVELSSLTSNALPTAETYLTFGVVPSIPMLKKMELSPSEIKKLSEIYNIPESQVKSILKALSTSLAEVTEDTLITESTVSTLTLKELTEVLETTEEPSIPDPTTPPEPEPPEPEPPEPPPKLSAADQQKRRELNLRLYNGPKEKYKVKISFPRGPSQTLTVFARSFPEAVNRAQRSRRGNRYLPSVVDVERVK